MDPFVLFFCRTGIFHKRPVLLLPALLFVFSIQVNAQTRDYGDLPSSFGTRNIENGSRHIVLPGFMLGTSVDVEADGTPSADASGDDLNNLDDEDGVVLPSSGLVPCTTASIRYFLTNTAGAEFAFVDTWIDFNGNGVYDVAIERITDLDPDPIGIASVPLTPGWTTHQFDVPCNAVPGPNYSRSRLSISGSLSVAGDAPDGEVEDHPVLILGVDYGDAPDNGPDSPQYSTLRSTNGPQHILLPGAPILGSIADGDTDGQPGTSGLGDDEDFGPFGDDEDGVADFTFASGSTNSCVNVVSSTGGLLNAWFDFNGNGQFDDPTERISASPNTTLSAGVTTPVCFNHAIPETLPATMYARFRISSAGGLSPTGPADDGEVEDYAFDTILPVELASFSIENEGFQVQLQWSTLSEDNNAGFEVQHSWNEDPFRTIAFVEGSGTTQDTKVYSYTPGLVSPGIHRFRLKQVDFDGAFEYSPVIERRIDLPGAFLLEPIYPNPFSDQATIRFTLENREPVKVILYDALGREQRVLYDGYPQAGKTQRISLDGHLIPNGMYLVRLVGATFSASQKVMRLQ